MSLFNTLDKETLSSALLFPLFLARQTPTSFPLYAFALLPQYEPLQSADNAILAVGVVGVEGGGFDVFPGLDALLISPLPQPDNKILKSKNAMVKYTFLILPPEVDLIKNDLKIAASISQISNYTLYVTNVYYKF
jgi:hypothetical protein